MTQLHNLPSVEQLLQTRAAAELVADFGRPLVLKAVRAALEQVRKTASKSPELTLPGREGLLASAADLLQEWTRPTLLPVINATGVILHTNLGRAPLSAAALEAIEAVGHGYATLEFNLQTGKRGARFLHAEGLLQKLTGAESALVVNNCAAAVLLILSALSNRKRVIIARSQLVEIGGGFRIPDVMKQAGAKLVEVGTTNKVRLSDYEEALTQPAGLVMRVHHSNFKITGFTEEPILQALAGLAQSCGIPCVDDLGSGTLLDTSRFGLTHEPTIQESIGSGADLVCFSGDKLLGGPQAGIIVGKAHLVEKLRTHPLARALRPDKICLAALTATLLHYLKDEAERAIPVWRMIAIPANQVKARAEAWAVELGEGKVFESLSTVGGGSLPGETLPSYVLALETKNADAYMQRLRQGNPPVIARTEDGQVWLDPRTVLPEQDGALLVNLMNARTNPASRRRG